MYTVTRHSRLKLAEELDDILILNKEVGFYNRGYVYIPDIDRYIDFATPFIIGESFQDYSLNSGFWGWLSTESQPQIAELRRV